MYTYSFVVDMYDTDCQADKFAVYWVYCSLIGEGQSGFTESTRKALSSKTCTCLACSPMLKPDAYSLVMYQRIYAKTAPEISCSSNQRACHCLAYIYI